MAAVMTTSATATIATTIIRIALDHPRGRASPLAGADGNQRAMVTMVANDFVLRNLFPTARGAYTPSLCRRFARGSRPVRNFFRMWMR
jgi:hypothetical protein